jgi:hypothetical protein
VDTYGGHARRVAGRTPVSLVVETFGTENVPVERIEKAVEEVFDLRPNPGTDRAGPAIAHIEEGE